MSTATDGKTESIGIPAVRGFWTWLFRKDEFGDRGVLNLFDRWNGIGLALATLFALSADILASDLAKSVALPGAAVLVGLSFAWAGRSSSLLQDKDFSEFIITNGPPAEGYIYSFQLAVLVVAIFVATSLCIVSGGIGLSTGLQWWDQAINRFVLSMAGFMAARECWGAIYFANKLSIQFFKVRERKLSAEQKQSPNTSTGDQT